MQAPTFLEVFKHHTLWVFFPTALSLIAVLLGLWALAKSFGQADQKRKAGNGAGVASIIAALAAAVGLMGALVSRQAVRAIWWATSLRADELRELTVLGYQESQLLVYVGAVVAALPILIALAVAFKAGAGRAVVSLAALGAIGVVGLGVYLTGPELGLADFEAHVGLRVRNALQGKDCDPCPVIAWGIENLDAEGLEEAAPGSRVRAQTCVDDRWKTIESGRYPDPEKTCAQSEVAPPPVLEDDPIPRRAGKTITVEEKPAALEELLASPLVVEDDQRQTLKTALAAAKKAAEPKPVVAPPPAPGKRPRGTATVGGAEVSGAPVSNAAAAVARMRGRFRRCYEQGLKKDPEIAGKVTLTAKVGVNGEVLSVAGGGGGSLRSIVPCLKAVVMSAAFSPPENGAASVVSIPITFARTEE